MTAATRQGVSTVVATALCLLVRDVNCEFWFDAIEEAKKPRIGRCFVTGTSERGNQGDGDAESVIAAAQLAGVHEMILRLPRGYETEVAPGGLNLSGGERQRIALARALFGDPRLVVLDEPNAALDAQGEDALLGVIDRLRDRKITSIVIAHRPNILRHVDSILVLRDGQIRLFGARDEILPRVITGGEPVRTELLAKAVGNG